MSIDMQPVFHILSGLFMLTCTTLLTAAVAMLRGMKMEAREERKELQREIKKVESMIEETRLDIAKNYVTWTDLREHCREKMPGKTHE